MEERYFDHAATTYVDKRVKAEMDKYFTEEYGNPGSFNTVGLRAQNAVDAARETVGRILNIKGKTDSGNVTDKIIFTGSGTESINLAIQGTLKARKNKGKHIITTKIEHHAVSDTLYYLAKDDGYEVTYLDVDQYGRVSAEQVEKAMREDTVLVSVMYANNEIGTINPIAEIGAMMKEKFKTVYFHTDACQAGGVLDIDVKKLNVDLLSLNGSKLYGPKGVGILYVRQGVQIKPIIYGGGQEFGLRSGTENVPSIVGFAKALELSQEEKEKENPRLIMLRDKLIKGMIEKIPKTFLNGHPIERLPNNVNITILDVEGEAVMLAMNEEGVCFSSGSACTSATLDPSHVILAIGLPYEAAHGSLRFTLGKETTEKDIEFLIEKLPPVIEKLRQWSPVKLEMEQVLEGRQ